MNRKKQTSSAKIPPDTAPAAKTGFDVSNLIATFVIAIGAVVAYHFVVANDSVAVAQTGRQAQGIVVVDAKAAVQGFMGVMEQRIASGEDFSESELTLSGADFGAEFLRAVKKYRDAGYLVIDKGNVLAVPANAEITEEIAEALGIKVELSPDPFAAPAVAMQQ